MAFAAALSQHPVTAHAIGEVAGEVLEHVGAAPDLALLFVTTHHAGALEDAAAVVRSVLSPTVVIGCSAESVAANGQEVEGRPAVALWAGHTGLLAPFRLENVATAAGAEVRGWPEGLAFDAAAAVVLADPYTFPAEDFLAAIAGTAPAVTVVGGMASGAMGPGGSRLTIDGRVVSTGAVGVLLGPGVTVETVVSQGCRPIGRPLVVTRAERNVVYELAGRPPLERLVEVARNELDEDQRRALQVSGVHVGRVVDERKSEFGPGDFLIRNVVGADRSNGAIAVADVLDVGTTVQFHVRDAATADAELRSLLAGRQADAALLFTCNGRGTRLFPDADHDASVLHDALGGVPAAGFFAQGEIGPVGGRSFLHGFTASVLLLRAPGGRGPVGRVQP